MKHYMSGSVYSTNKQDFDGARWSASDEMVADSMLEEETKETIL